MTNGHKILFNVQLMSRSIQMLKIRQMWLTDVLIEHFERDCKKHSSHEKNDLNAEVQIKLHKL